MKYGLIYYKDTDNLGDDILSYAAKQFLPKVDYYIDREAMDLFVPEEEEAVASILNGWYLHYVYSFPPSPYILPLFVGTHFAKNVIGNYSYLENSFVVDYLKKYEPIGCRDIRTYQVLKGNGVQSYFSGCLTLTLQPFSEGVDENNNIILTDVPEKVENYVRSILPNKNIIKKTHVISQEEVGAPWELREKKVEEYLKLYQSAELVITTRLHCALPAIALGTKVLLISKFDEDWKQRMSDYKKYCIMFSAEEILDGKADNMLVSPDLIQCESVEGVKKELVQVCKDFIGENEKSKEWNNLPTKEQYNALYVNRTLGMRQYILKLIQQFTMVSKLNVEQEDMLKQSESVIKKLVELVEKSEKQN